MSRPSGEPASGQACQVRTAQDLVALLAEQVQAVRSDPEAGPLEKARTIGQLAAIMLRCIEMANLAARVEALEMILEGRKGNEE